MVHFPSYLKKCPSLPEFTLETLMCQGEKYSIVHIVVQDLLRGSNLKPQQNTRKGL